MTNKLGPWRAEAPSNIALIKYMGKTDRTQNKPTNESLSYTLQHLQSVVEVSAIDSAQDEWRPLLLAGQAELNLSEKSISRFLRHAQAVKDYFGVKQAFRISSANDFPSDCGLASSSSSFAALTMAVARAACELSGQVEPTAKSLAELSRRGSGSSCRSFFSPWSQWSADGASEIDLGVETLLHQVVVVNDRIKTVSSSEAHLRVADSPLFVGRPERAEHRLHELTSSIRAADWERSYQLIWTEFWDMHALFETSRPAFGYMTAGSLDVMMQVRRVWEDEKDGPWVTMDAGPNVHLLYRQDQAELAKRLHHEFGAQYQVISSLEQNHPRRNI